MERKLNTEEKAQAKYMREREIKKYKCCLCGHIYDRLEHPDEGNFVPPKWICRNCGQAANWKRL